MSHAPMQEPNCIKASWRVDRVVLVQLDSTNSHSSGHIMPSTGGSIDDMCNGYRSFAWSESIVVCRRALTSSWSV
jgi:hypothetical protein